LQNLPSGLSFREHRAFERLARDLVRLPGPGEGPLDYLLPEARWQELTQGVPDEAAWLMALSRYGRGRTGTRSHRVTIFYGGASAQSYP
jgi:hypothetical protein